MTTLVYQAYGPDDIIDRTLFSVVSLFSVVKTASAFSVWIYTDQKKRFAEFFGDWVGGPAARIYLVGIDASQLQKWRGAIDFVHRVKIEILRDAGEKFDGPLYYADGDTYFRGDPTEKFRLVNDVTSLMHVAEKRLSLGRDWLSMNLAAFLERNLFTVGGVQVHVPPETIMWNAGVLGLSHKNKSLFQPVLELTDQIYSRCRLHVMEQLAFSHYLQTSTNVVACDDVISHYWNQKDEFQAVIDHFFARNSNWPQAQKAYSSFQPPTSSLRAGEGRE